MFGIIYTYIQVNSYSLGRGSNTFGKILYFWINYRLLTTGDSSETYCQKKKKNITAIGKTVK